MMPEISVVIPTNENKKTETKLRTQINTNFFASKNLY